MSWESTVPYYQVINRRVAERLGGLHSASLLLWSPDFAEIERLQAADAWDEAGDMLGAGARRLVDAGAELLVLCTNTMHRVADAVEAAAGRPLLHIADATGERLRALGGSRTPRRAARCTGSSTRSSVAASSTTPPATGSDAWWTISPGRAPKR